MNDLHAINKNAVYSKLDNIKLYDGCYRCNDVFSAISKSITRDKRIINNFDSDEIVLKKIKVKTTRRICRCFTRKGIIKYIHIGKIISYVHVCKYFNEPPIDKTIEKIKSYANNKGMYKTKDILKWLFGKRKQTKYLYDTVTLKILITWVKGYKGNDILIDRKNALLKFAGYDINTNQVIKEVSLVDECGIELSESEED